MRVVFPPYGIVTLFDTVMTGAEAAVGAWDATETVTYFVVLSPLTLLVHFMPYCVVV